LLIKKLRPWDLPDHRVTPESTYWNRRDVLRALGLTGTATLIGGCGLSVDGDPLADISDWNSPYDAWHPVPRNEAYAVPERDLTNPIDATTFNNYYEFTPTKDQVHRLVGDFVVEPWTIEIAGLCNNPGVFDLEDWLDRFALEERIYRHRCVETWAMTVPWSGFSLAELIAYADPTSDARFVRFVSENRPDQMPGIEVLSNFPWPYHEGLTMDEATNELAFMVTGMYGIGVPRQNGAPLRLVVPWKYGYKSIKSIIRIEFVAEQPPTLWSTAVTNEYPFESHVDPAVPHPRWSQAEEWLLGDDQDVVPTMKYNGYGEYVAHLYE
jgi:sulfoxide reductase catalytic subunit YedY